MLLLIPWTWCLKKIMKMLLLWNIMQTMNFNMIYKYEMFSGYSIVMIWTQPVRVIVLAFPWWFWLAIISGKDSAIAALVGNSQLVEDANRPPWLMIWSHQNEWYFLIWSWDYLALWRMLDAWHYVLEAFQNYDRLTIGLINMYHEWAIKLFGNYKEKLVL